MIREVLMEAGGFDVELRPDTPKSVLDSIQYFGGLTVTPVHLPAPEDIGENPLRSIALYTGVVTGLSNDRRVIEGYGPAYLLGTSGGLSDTYEADQTPGALDLETWIKSKVLTGASDDLNGITVGTIGTAGGMSKAGTITKGSTPLDVLNWVVNDLCGGNWLTDEIWKINPDLTLDVDNYTAIARNGARLFTNLDGDNSRPGTDSEIIGFRGKFTLETDVEDWTSRVVVEDTSGGTGSAANSESYAPITSGSDIERTRFYDSSKTVSGNANAAAAGILERYNTTRLQLSVEVFDSYALAHDVTPGDLVWYYDAELNLIGNGQYYYRGTVVRPDYAFVTGHDWPLQRGMGVYVTESDGTSGIVDLTEWVVWEDRNPVVHIGATPRPLAVVEEPGTAH